MVGNGHLEPPSTSFRVKYIGSFMVIGDGSEGRMNCVRMHLETMRRTLHNCKPVLLDVSLSGIRLLSLDGQTVHMVHALKRVSYATCDPDSCQFAFSARQPSNVTDGSKAPPPPHHQHPLPGGEYCHVFVTDAPEKAKEINDYVSNIFREAERGIRACRDPTIYYEFPNDNKFNISTNHHEEKRDTSHSSASSASSSTFSGNINEVVYEEKRGVLLERKRREKHALDLCHIIDVEGPCSTTGLGESATAVNQSEMQSAIDTTAGHPTGSSPQADFLSATSASSSQKSLTSADIASSKGSANSSRHCHFTDSKAPTPTRGSFPEDQSNSGIIAESSSSNQCGENSVAGDCFKSPLRPQSKRQKRRPLSAVFTNFGGAGKYTGTNEFVSGENSREHGHGVKNEGGKNGSIIKRLLHLKLSSASSLRLNFLGDKSSSNSTDHLNVAANGRQRVSQSVRGGLGTSLDQTNDHACPSNAPLLPIASKRRRRPLSAVFGNSGSNPVNGHHEPMPCSWAMPSGRNHSVSNVTALNPGDTPSGTKKLGSAKSAVCKMFGFSSSRRKSRSTVQLDTVRRPFTLSPDLSISNSVNSERDPTASRRPSQPFVDDISHWKEPFHRFNVIDTPLDNCGSPLLGNGVGCGEHCSVSMPNLRYGLDHCLPLSDEEEKRLKDAAWFCGTVARQPAAEILGNEPEGAFIVRRSSNHQMSLVLSVRVPFSHNPSGVSHYLILHTAKGFKLKGFTKDFPSVHALVTHHSFMAEQLPCRLVFTERNERDVRLYSLFNASSFSMSNVIFNDHHPHQLHQQHQRRSSQSRHSSPFINKRHDLVPVTEEEGVYGKVPSPPPPPRNQPPFIS